LRLVKKTLDAETKKKIDEYRFWEKIEVVSLNYWLTGRFKVPYWLWQKDSVSETFDSKELG